MACVQVSFVNSICTSKGGTHVNYITDQVWRLCHSIVEKLLTGLISELRAPLLPPPARAKAGWGAWPGSSQHRRSSTPSATRQPPSHPASTSMLSLQLVKYLCEMINKKDKKANVKPFMAKNYLWVFVNCLIENPAFDSQVGWAAKQHAGWQQAQVAVAYSVATGSGSPNLNFTGDVEGRAMQHCHEVCLRISLLLLPLHSELRHWLPARLPSPPCALTAPHWPLPCRPRTP